MRHKHDLQIDFEDITIKNKNDYKHLIEKTVIYDIL